MKLLDTLASADRIFSLEFFPPKKELPLDSVYESISRLGQYEPAFVSVTYGAGGGNRDRTIEIASYVQNTGGEAIAHLTCVGATPAAIQKTLSELKEKGIGNVLALRGDIPEGMDRDEAFLHYRHASDLIADIKKSGGFAIAAAAYPEMHVDNTAPEENISSMRIKAETGADFFVTQLCFDRHAIVDFFEQVAKAGIHAPVLTGIMPVLNPRQIIRMALLSACSIPASLSRIISRYGGDADAFFEAGIEYAIDEIAYLRQNGINKFHLYTMNKSEAVERILAGSGLARATS
jgi:5,10-methylenetetrahydrofolate reductase